MQLTLNIRKSLEQTANEYFEQAKKAKRKAQGARAVVEKFKAQLVELEKKQQVMEEKQANQKKEKRTLEWYEKFRWFISSDGFLCIGGRDATSNEIVVKKHTENDDLIFHTEMPGSPFFVIKTNGKKPGEQTLQETADATATFSKAWKLGLAAAEVFLVKPEQVSKKAESGEYMPKGGFMIRGKRTNFQGKITAAVGKLDSGKVMCGPESAVKINCKKIIMVQPGKEKPSDCAKLIAKKLEANIDDVLRVLPGGTCQVK